VSALAAGCGSTAASTGHPGLEKPDLTVAVVPASGAAGLYIAQADGFFTAAGLHVKIVPTASGGNVLPELVRGAVDVDEGQWTSAIAAQAAGVARLHALTAGNAGGPGVQQVTVLPSSGIRTVKDLAGKTIAVNALAGLTVLLIDTVLEENGLSPAQAHYVVIPFPAMGAALAAHRVDAAFMIEPYLTQAETTSGVEELFDLDQGATQNFPLTGYVVTQAWMKRYPKTAAAFTAALERGQRIAATSRPAVDKALVANTTVTKQTAAVMATGTFPLRVSAVDLGRVADLMQEQHALNASVDVTRLVQGMTR
jgi:NitT/TauT family transport system substrate-binding protein